ncbi:MAG: hypothetical protein UW79_C0023G0034 [Candidatus Yanofskybacteria bacterium GW2011_GWA2_44_9]|nr:MAG: hypothetical protein UW79_C0023G0034 [Candidatus Yanofskybacteria bacterium GW2011_GWA2_44_9]
MAEPTAKDIGIPQLKQLMDRDFWIRPEGRFGKIVLGILGVATVLGIGFNALPILNYIVAVFQLGIQAIWYAFYLFALYVIATNRWIRALVGSAFRAAVRSMVGMFVNMAPIAVARDYIAYSRKKLASGLEAAKRFKAKMLALFQVIEKFKITVDQQEALAKKHNRAKNFEEAQAAQIRAERTRKRIQALENMYTKMETLMRALDTILRKAKLRVDSAEAELEDQITMYEASMDTKHAIADVKEAIGATSSTPKEMADMAAAKMALEIAGAVVEMDDMINLSEELFSGIDAEEAVISERAMRRFQEWEQESHSSVLAPGEKADLLRTAQDPAQPYDLTTVESPAGQTNTGNKFDVNDFFKN